MNHSKFKTVSLLVLGLLALAGCGGSGSNSGSSNDPLATNNQAPVTEPTPTGSGTVLDYALTLTTSSTSDSATVGANSTVIATATLKDSNGNFVSGQPIKFEEVIDPANGASVSIAAPVVNTSSGGVATAIIRTGNPASNTDVIIRASTSVNGQLVSAVSIFKIVRSAGNYINFITTKETTDPTGSLNTVEVDITAVDPLVTPRYNILQLVTFEVLDRNGINRTSVPVKLDLFSVLGNVSPGNGITGVDNCAVFIDNPETSAQTVTTDNTGLGIFNSEINMRTPEIGSETSCSVILKATSTDPYTVGATLFSYGGYIVTLKNKKN